MVWMNRTIIDVFEKTYNRMIATHSPVITAFPEAKIYEIVKGSFYNSEYEDIDNVRFLKQFLSDPKRFFRG